MVQAGCCLELNGQSKSVQEPSVALTLADGVLTSVAPSLGDVNLFLEIPRRWQARSVCVSSWSREPASTLT